MKSGSKFSIGLAIHAIIACKCVAAEEYTQKININSREVLVMNHLEIKNNFQENVIFAEPATINIFINNIKIIIDNELLINSDFFSETNMKFILQQKLINTKQEKNKNLHKINIFANGVDNRELIKFQFKNTSANFENNYLNETKFGMLNFEFMYSLNAGIEFGIWNSIFNTSYIVEMNQPLYFDPSKISRPTYRYGVATNKYKYKYDTKNTNVEIILDVNFDEPLNIKHVSIIQNKKVN